MQTTASYTAAPVRTGWRLANLLWAAPAAGFVAALPNAGLYYAATAAGWLAADLKAPSGDAINVVPVVLGSLMPALVAGLFLFLLIRFTRRPALIFRVVGVAFLLFSFASPFGIPGVDTSSMVVLNAMHVIAGAVILYLLPRWSRAG